MTMSDSRFVLASRLAQFLRKNGDKIINGSCKLSLTTSALCLLNSLFLDVLNQDINAHPNFFSYVTVTIHEDVKYLYDFMKKTSSLKLFHGMQTLRGGVDLSHFSNLTVLELRKIPAHLIIGLSTLSLQLKALICSRSIYLLKELFGNSVDEQSPACEWTELRELNLSYNYLENLDRSIRNTPFIEMLDLSHNNLKNTDEIQVLKRLTGVNLSYNQLESLPLFNSICCRYLSKLYIRNNNLENLDGLECFFNLEELDVGCNLLSEYSVLAPLDKLKLLKLLNLEGNPLYFHSQHFRLLCSYIHPFALHRGLCINGKLIAVPQNLILSETNKDEESDSGRHQTSINTVVGDIHAHPSEMTDKTSLDENSASSCTSQNSVEQAIRTKPKRKRLNSKGSRAKLAVINDPDEQVDESKSCEDFNIPSHSRIKEMFEARRKERGQSWLIPDNPFKILESNPIVPSNTPDSRPGTAFPENDVLLSNQVLIERIIEEFQRQENDVSTLVCSEMEEVKVETQRKRHISNQSDDIEVLALNLMEPDKLESMEEMSDCEFYENATLEYSPAEMSSNSENESEDSILLAERIDGNEHRIISVQIGAKFAKERDAITGELLDRLDLSSLLSINRANQEKESGKQYEVRLEFDTVKTSRQQRLYVFQDLHSAKRVCKILQPYADANAFKEATLGALECMNCKSQFSKEVSNRKVRKTKKLLNSKDFSFTSYNLARDDLEEVHVCPNCGNDIIVELELPSIAMSPHVSHSPGCSSIGSSSSSGFVFSNLLNTFKISPVSKRKVFSGPLNDNPDVVQSSGEICVYQSEKDCLKQRGSELQMSRNSSDITIVSNPSQSSIAVIPEPVIESNLNTIVEGESQSSLSPPVSQNSAVLDDDKEDAHNEHNFVFSSKEDPDFYSLTESLATEREKLFKSSDVVSDDSDIFYSPHKSPNSQTVRKAEDCDKLMQILGEKNLVTGDSFLHLDHRLKLHIEINILGRDEHMNSCLQTSIVPLSSGEEFEGVFLLTSKNVCVIKFLAQYSAALKEHESLEKQVQVLYRGPLSRAKQIKVLLGNQGICVACGPPTHVYTLVIRDVDICNSFCNLISEQILEKNPRFECLTLAEVMLQVLYESVLSAKSEEKPEILLHQFAFKKDKDVVLPVCITLTKEDLFLSKIFYKKQQSCSDLTDMQAYFFANSDCQKVSDVISLNLAENFLSVEIHFLIESSDVESVSWTVELQTKSAMFSFINALKSPWEELFAVPLPLTSNKISHLLA